MLAFSCLVRISCWVCNFDFVVRLTVFNFPRKKKQRHAVADSADSLSTREEAQECCFELRWPQHIPESSHHPRAESHGQRRAVATGGRQPITIHEDAQVGTDRSSLTATSRSRLSCDCCINQKAQRDGQYLDSLEFFSCFGFLCSLGSWFRSAQLRIENCGVSRSRDGQAQYTM